MPKVTASAQLACYGIFVDSATWAGVPLSDVLRLAGAKDGAKTVQLVGADEYKVSIPLAEALKDGNFLAYEWQGQPLPILHGFPLRAVFPGQPGNEWVKWLVEIVVG
jgi:DMSO/TMAO reductase YedYZ molybdopterin-dependent catalytic subunit